MRLSANLGFIISIGNRTMFVVTPIDSGSAGPPPSLTDVVKSDFTTIFSGNDFTSSRIDNSVFILPPSPVLAKMSLKLFSFPLKILFTLIKAEVESVFLAFISNSSIIDSPKLAFTERVIASEVGDCTRGLIVFTHTLFRTVSL